MRCDEIKYLLYEAKDPTAPLAGEAEDHLAHCPTCQALRGDQLALRQAMATLPLPPLPTGFAFSLRQRLKAAEVEKQKLLEQKNTALRSRWKVLALAASLILLFSIGLFWRIYQINSTEHALPLSYFNLHLSIDTAQDAATAHLDLRMPPGVALPSQTGLSPAKDQALRLTSHLQQGKNELALPLVVQSLPATVEAHLRLMNQHAVRKIMLSADPSPRTAAGSIAIFSALALYLPFVLLRKKRKHLAARKRKCTFNHYTEAPLFALARVPLFLLLILSAHLIQAEPLALFVFSAKAKRIDETQAKALARAVKTMIVAVDPQSKSVVLRLHHRPLSQLGTPPNSAAPVPSAASVNLGEKNSRSSQKYHQQTLHPAKQRSQRGEKRQSLAPHRSPQAVEQKATADERGEGPAVNDALLGEAQRLLQQKEGAPFSNRGSLAAPPSGSTGNRPHLGLEGVPATLPKAQGDNPAGEIQKKGRGWGGAAGRGGAGQPQREGFGPGPGQPGLRGGGPPRR
jgi:hypothetical protein